MIFLTQLVYIRAGKEAVFQQFEEIALPLVARHGGELLLRVRPNAGTTLACQGEIPYEIHLLRFDSDEAFARFAGDGERQRFLHLKNESVRATLLVKGTAF